MRTTLLAAMAAFVLSSTAPSAVAEAPITTVRVAYADLDLNDARGARTMLHRIRKAAAKACAQNGNGFDEVQRFDACHAQAVAQAVVNLKAPRVTAEFAAAAPRRGVAWKAVGGGVAGGLDLPD